MTRPVPRPRETALAGARYSWLFQDSMAAGEEAGATVL